MSDETTDGGVSGAGDSTGNPLDEQFYRDMFVGAPDPVVVADADTRRVVAANQAVADLLGRPRAALRGASLSTLHPPEAVDQYEEVFERFTREGAESAAAVSTEAGIHLVDAEGARIPVDVTARPLVSGGDRYVVAVLRDLRERERRDWTLERLHEATRDLIATDSAAEVYAVASRTAEDILGLPLHLFLRYDPDRDVLVPAAVSDRATDLFPDLGAFERADGGAFWRVFETGEPVVSGAIREDPAVLDPETPVRSEFIVPIGEYGVFVAASTRLDDFDPIDVSLAKVLAANVEDTLQRTERERELRERARQIRTVVKNAPMVLFAFDDEGVFTLSDGRALDHVGLEPGEAVGQSISDLYADNETILESCRRALAGERVQSTSTVGNRVFETWYRPVVEDGDVQQVIGTAVDVTQRERREQLLRVLNRFLRHNLRNAITVVLGNAETNAEHEDPAVSESARAVLEAGTRLDRLTTKARNLIQMLEVEDPAAVDLRDALELVVTAVEAEYDVTVDVDRPDEAVRVEEFVVFGVRELLENAVEHGSEPVALRARATDDGNVTLAVTDDGPGLPAHERAVLGGADETPLDHGSGLGLFVASWVVTRAGGEIDLVETDRNGTRIEVSVPATLPDASQQDGTDRETRPESDTP